MASISSSQNIGVIMDVVSEILESQQIIHHSKNVKTFIINRCQWYHQNRFKYRDLKDMNKRVIQESYQYLMKMKQQSVNPNNLSNIHSKKGNDFELRLKDHQNNFNTLINGNKPDEIDFSDKLEEDIIDTNNIDYIMSQTLADREKELEKITNTYSGNNKEKAEQWLNSENSTIKLDIKENVSLNDTINIPSSIVKNSIKPNKKVRFNDNTNGINDGMDKNIISEIKQFITNQKDESSNIIIIEKLDTIIKNQNLIIKHLNIEKKRNPTAILNNNE